MRSSLQHRRQRDRGCDSEKRFRHRRLPVESLEHRLCLSAAWPSSHDDGVAAAVAPARRFAAPAAAAEPLAITDPINFIRFPGEGFKNLAVSPTGELGRLLWAGDELQYQVRSPTGRFETQVVPTELTPLGGYSPRGRGAQLLYREDGQPVVVVEAEQGVEIFERESDTDWLRTATANYASQDPFEYTAHLAADIGPDGSIHVLVTVGFIDTGRLMYATDRTGQWEFVEVTDVAAVQNYSHFSGLYPRFVSMMVDGEGRIHATYTPEFLDFGTGGYSRPFDQLAYLSNASGAWQTEIVHQPSDDSGQSGFGASLALAPNGQPAIAHFFVDRYSTGSAVASRLLFHQRQPGGGWASETVVDRPDGYVAADGAKFTGFAPHLRFDAFGRPHIAFSDHASQHFGPAGADEFAGQIRHAVKRQGGWSTSVVFGQSDPLRQVMVYPTLAILPNALVFTGIQRLDQLDQDLNVVDSRHNLVESVIPQIGLTIEIAGVPPGTGTAHDASGGSIPVLLRRHHDDVSSAVSVQLRSGDAAVLPPQEFLFPAGQDQLSVMADVDVRSIAPDGQLLELTVTQPGYYPGSTVVRVTPPNLLWHSAAAPHDVNDNGQVTPLDALNVINWIAIHGAGPAPETFSGVIYPDTNADGQITPRDALAVINHLARAMGSASGEEAPTSRPLPALLIEPAASATAPDDEAVVERLAEDLTAEHELI